MKQSLLFVFGFALAAALFSTPILLAQADKAPSDYSTKASVQVKSLLDVNASLLGVNGAKPDFSQSLEAFKATQKFFSTTTPPTDFAPFHSQALFASAYCKRAAETTLSAKKEKDMNMFSAILLLDMADKCAFAIQDTAVLYLQANGLLPQ